MREEDYLLRQIDQLGEVLARLLGSILGLKEQGKETEIESLVDNTLKRELGIDLTGIKNSPNDKVVELLKQNKEVSIENLDKIADILLEIANGEENKETKRIYFERILEIYDFIGKNDKTYSYARHLKIERIKNEISI